VRIRGGREGGGFRKEREGLKEGKRGEGVTAGREGGMRVREGEEEGRKG